MKMCQALADSGHEVVLLAPDRHKEYEEDIDDIYTYYNVKNNFEVKKLFTFYLKRKTFAYIPMVIKYLLKNKPDLVYGRFVYGCYASSLLGYKTILESHTPIYNETRLSKTAFTALINNKNFQKLVVISQVLKDMYLENGYLDKGKIQVAHDGADRVLDFEDKAKLRGKKENLKVGYVGHLYSGKGMEVIKEIYDKVPGNVEFHIIGGTENDIDYWKKLIKSSNVYFYGFIAQQYVSSYINALDICLLPNQKNIYVGSTNNKGSNIGSFTSPLKMFDYMAHKKPIIASNIPVLREVLNNDNSILVSADKPAEWIKAIKKLQDSSIREQLGENALHDFNSYTWKNRALEVIGK